MAHQRRPDLQVTHVCAHGRRLPTEALRGISAVVESEYWEARKIGGYVTPCESSRESTPARECPPAPTRGQNFARIANPPQRHPRILGFQLPPVAEADTTREPDRSQREQTLQLLALV